MESLDVRKFIKRENLEVVWQVRSDRQLNTWVIAEELRLDKEIVRKISNI